MSSPPTQREGLLRFYDAQLARLPAVAEELEVVSKELAELQSKLVGAPDDEEGANWLHAISKLEADMASLKDEVFTLDEVRANRDIVAMTNDHDSDDNILIDGMWTIEKAHLDGRLALNTQDNSQDIVPPRRGGVLTTTELLALLEGK